MLATLRSYSYHSKFAISFMYFSFVPASFLLMVVKGCFRIHSCYKAVDFRSIAWCGFYTAPLSKLYFFRKGSSGNGYEENQRVTFRKTRYPTLVTINDRNPGEYVVGSRR